MEGKEITKREFRTLNIGDIFKFNHMVFVRIPDIDEYTGFRDGAGDVTQTRNALQISEPMRYVFIGKKRLVIRSGNINIHDNI